MLLSAPGGFLGFPLLCGVGVIYFVAVEIAGFGFDGCWWGVLLVGGILLHLRCSVLMVVSGCWVTVFGFACVFGLV